MKTKNLTLRTDPMTKLLLALVAAGLWWHAFAPWVSSSAHADGVTKVDVVSLAGEKIQMTSQEDLNTSEPDSLKRKGLPVCNVNTR
ncbi:MAG: hypothetical protein EBQ51_02195 [Verrucomicrobia bacterium]|nr:hypothetical protein [Pseudomonadota bacterium]NBS07036.1 hypothetical protein [Verrucomicrobiota bacterium]NBS78471.1 hypothetical protein [bacterium]NBS49551.1 hypothetical protein [Verrucomicrobiota bacterium]NBT23323.1 hypothetical protein [bacterium]